MQVARGRITSIWKRTLPSQRMPAFVNDRLFPMTLNITLYASFPSAQMHGVDIQH